MLNGKIVVRDNWRTIARIEAKYIKESADVAKNSAEFMANFIKDNWSSAPAPSNAGQAPALDKEINTGNLDSAIKAQGNGRDLGGRFAGKDSVVHFVNLDTSKGKSPNGRGNYTLPLEEGVPSRNQAPRPFVQPALDATFKHYKSEMKRKLK